MFTKTQDNQDLPIFFFRFEKGKLKDKSFTLQIDICEDPLCDCRDITIEFYNDNNHKEILSKITLDINEKKILERTDNNPKYNISDEIVKHLTNKDWYELLLVHDEYKSLICEYSDYSELSTDFSFYEIEVGELILYDDIIPFGIQILIKIQDKHYKIVDLYCLNTKCRCNDAHLFFYPMIKRNKPVDHDLYVEYNYKNEKWKIKEQNIETMDYSIFMSHLNESYDIKEIFKNRHDNLKKLYKNYRRRFIKENLLAHSRDINRNDPCPCGSGKKYKKCCMEKNAL